VTELLVERTPNGVALLRLNRPAARNAITMSLRRDLAACFVECAEDSSVRVVIVTGDAKAFAAGADVAGWADAGSADMMTAGVAKLWEPIAACPKPIIAAVNGFALGAGCELAMHCDIIIAGQSAKFGQPEVKLGIMPGAGGTQRLVRAIGKFRAMRMVLRGEIIPASLAYEWGLVSELVPDDQVLAHAQAVADELAALPQLALHLIKEAVLTGPDLPLPAALALERKSMHLLFDTADQKEGMRAFLEKRPPRFTHR
jgi:enoyl-CoA hydratase/carnithine racemase